jgi:hypothetical protein
LIEKHLEVLNAPYPADQLGRIRCKHINNRFTIHEFGKTIRDKDAQECGYDVHRLFGKLREETENLSRQGWEVVSTVHHQNTPYPPDFSTPVTNPH